MRALLALGNRCRLSPRAPDPLRPLCQSRDAVKTHRPDTNFTIKGSPPGIGFARIFLQRANEGTWIAEFQSASACPCAIIEFTRPREGPAPGARPQGRHSRKLIYKMRCPARLTLPAALALVLSTAATTRAADSDPAHMSRDSERPVAWPEGIIP